MSYPLLAEAVSRNALVLAPIGQTEEHGPHLPTGTDAMIADAVACGIEQELEGELPVVVVDTFRCGYSVRDVARWPGLIGLTHETVTNTMREACGSLVGMGFRKVAILSSHGNHPGLLEMVSRRLADEHDVDVPVLSVGGLARGAIEQHAKGGEGASCHAGEFETSVMLHLHPDLVDTARYPAGDRITVPNPAGSAVFWSTWRRQKSESGVYGDPTVASAEKGKKFMDGIVENACAFLRVYYAHPGVTRAD
jgi:creatinine amidohydrolase